MVKKPLNETIMSRNNERVNGFSFQWRSEESEYQPNMVGHYECRGEIMYDDEHDQVPEPALWNAAMKLEEELYSEGFLAEANHSEKGWVEVTVFKKDKNE